MSVRDGIAAVVGSRGTVEGTGGGCEALTFPLEGGLLLVVTDGNYTVPAVGGWNGLAVVVMPAEAWGDSGAEASIASEEIEAWGRDEYVSPDEAAAVVRRVLSAAVTA